MDPLNTSNPPQHADASPTSMPVFYGHSTRGSSIETVEGLRAENQRLSKALNEYDCLNGELGTVTFSGGLTVATQLVNMNRDLKKQIKLLQDEIGRLKLASHEKKEGSQTLLLKEKVSKLEKEIKELEEYGGDLRENYKVWRRDKNKEIDELNRKFSTSQSELEKVKVTRSAWQEKHASLDESMRKAESRYLSKLKENEAKLQDANARNTNLSTQVADQKYSNSQAEERKKQLEVSLAAAVEGAEARKEEIEKMFANIQALKSKIEEFKRKRTEQSDDIIKLKAKIEELRDEKAMAENSLLKESEGHCKELAKLEQENAENENYLQREKECLMRKKVALEEEKKACEDFFKKGLKTLFSSTGPENKDYEEFKKKVMAFCQEGIKVCTSYQSKS